MSIDLTKALVKLDRPPSGPNWVRFIHETRPKTTRAILQFVNGIPSFTYQPGLVAIRDQLLFGIGRDAALKVTARSGAPAGRDQNRDFVEAFFEFDKSRAYPVGTCVEFERQWFRISREIIVPVSPLAIFRERGSFVPLFVCGWAQLALTTDQRRLLMTICEDAFLFFPKVEVNGKKTRRPEVWGRGDYSLLTPSELDEQVQRYLMAREEAREVLFARLEDEKRRLADEARNRAERSGPDEMDDLFNPDRDNKK